MNKKEFMKIKEELQCKLGKWKLEIGDEILADLQQDVFMIHVRENGKCMLIMSEEDIELD